MGPAPVICATLNALIVRVTVMHNKFDQYWPRTFRDVENVKVNERIRDW